MQEHFSSNSVLLYLTRILVSEMRGKKCSFTRDDLRSIDVEPQSQLLTYKFGSFTATKSSASWERVRYSGRGASFNIVSVGRGNS